MGCQQRKARGYSKTSRHVPEPDRAPPAAAGRDGGDTGRSEGPASLAGLKDRRPPGSGRTGFRREAEFDRGLGWALDEARSSAAGGRLDARVRITARGGFDNRKDCTARRG